MHRLHGFVQLNLLELPRGSYHWCRDSKRLKGRRSLWYDSQGFSRGSLCSRLRKSPFRIDKGCFRNAETVHFFRFRNGDGLEAMAVEKLPFEFAKRQPCPSHSAAPDTSKEGWARWMRREEQSYSRAFWILLQAVLRSLAVPWPYLHGSGLVQVRGLI